MKTTAIKLFGIFLLSLTTFSCSPYFTDDMSEEVGTTVQNVNYTNMELDLLRGINNERAAQNLVPLETFNVISVIAEEHSKYMVEIGESTKENEASRASKLAVNANAANSSEVISTTTKTTSQILNDWKEDATCKEDMLNKDYTHFGIGVETDATGKHFITLIFMEEFTSKFSN